jgi:hypothetical protein
MARHDERGTALLEPPSRGHEPTRGQPGAAKGMRAFWPLMILILVGTLALVLWAAFGTGTSTLETDAVPASTYTGDWKDSIGSTPVGSTTSGDATGTYTGDWKDSIGSAENATP